MLTLYFFIGAILIFVTLKKSLKDTILCVFLLFCFVPFLEAQEAKYGLQFASHEVEKENRTGLDLTPKKPFHFPKGFSIAFDMMIKRKNHQIFGCIVRIIGSNSQSIDLILTSEFPNYPNIVANGSKTGSLLNYKFSDFENTYDQWVQVAISFEMDSNRLFIAIGKKDYSFYIPNANDFKNVNIVFGKNDYLKSRIRDVPSMVIKDITIKDAKEKPLYLWRLSKHASNGVCDELENHFAVCSNPIWIADEHAKWEKLVTFNTKNNPQICYNEKTNEIAIADTIAFYIYNPYTGILKKDSLTYGQPNGNQTNQLIYDPIIDKYLSYSFEKEFSYYDSQKKTWNNDMPDFEQYHWHHNRYFYPGDSSLYLFFGYGHHQYRSEIIKYNFRNASLETIAFKGAQVPPRYLSGLGKIDDDRIIFFGGYGNPSGNQEFAPHNYYDAYLVNLKIREIKKLWDLNAVEHDFVVSNSLVVDTVHRCFYALCYPQHEYKTYITLCRFSLDKPEYDMLADSIPFAFQDTHSYADLFFDKKNDKLFALTSSPLIQDSIYAVSVYSLAYPPLARADIYQKAIRENTFGIAPAIIVGLLGLCCGYLVYIFGKKRKQTKDSLIDNLHSSFIPDRQYDPVYGIKPVNTRLKKQSIFLFGGFQVIDKEEKNITNEFTPLLKDLFIIILLYTLKDGKGISSIKLHEILWFDKNGESSNNNRRVALSKLRQIFEQVGVVHIKKQNESWVVEFGEDIYCDYYEALIIINRLKERSNRTGKDIRRLLSIVSLGELLPNLQTEWVDPFKADFSNDLINLFMDIAGEKGIEISQQEWIDLADSILIHDSLNEEALYLKCSILIKMGKNGLAKKAYNSFVKEYRLLFGVDFKYSFEQIISIP